MDYSKYFSQISLRRNPSAIRALQQILQKNPDCISLGGGMPNPSTFPLEKVELTLKSGKKVDLSGPALTSALQYSGSYGIPDLVSFLKDFQMKTHKPVRKPEEWSVCVGNGCQDLLAKAFEMLLDPSDIILTENPTYSGALASLVPLGVKIVGIEVDENGMIPEKLEAILESFHLDSPFKKPKALYIIPNGQNPAGCSISFERKKEVYRIACEHDLVVLEDDPYYHLTYDLNHSIPSFFSMDFQGRVIRFDSFSKVLSAGLRIGFCTGPLAFLERIQLHIQSSLLHASGISQSIVLSILKEWGSEGWARHIKFLKGFYHDRMKTFEGLAKKHLSGLAEWSPPTAGMFMWFKLIGINDTKALIENECVKEKVLLITGQAFDPTGKPSSYVRASFSTATKEQMDMALERFATVIKHHPKNSN